MPTNNVTDFGDGTDMVDLLRDTATHLKLAMVEGVTSETIALLLAAVREIEVLRVIVGKYDDAISAAQDRPI